MMWNGINTEGLSFDWMQICKAPGTELELWLITLAERCGSHMPEQFTVNTKSTAAP